MLPSSTPTVLRGSAAKKLDEAPGKKKRRRRMLALLLLLLLLGGWYFWPSSQMARMRQLREEAFDGQLSPE